MEFANFFKLVKRYRIALIIVPIIAALVTYVLVRDMANIYQSTAQMATGMVDRSQQSVLTQAISEPEIAQEFSNMITVMQMKKVVDQVSYQLMLNDLTTDAPFRKPSKELKSMGKSARDHAIEVFTRLYQNHQPLYLFDPDQAGLNRLLISMGYDAAAISAKLTIYRAETSDFIKVDYESDNPELSAFVVNNLIKEFINFYTKQNRNNQQKTVVFLDNTLQEKKRVLDSVALALKNYKIQNNILNLTEQSRSLYSQIAEFEAKKQETQRDTAAKGGAIRNIDKKFDPNDRKYFESSLTKLNSEIAKLTSERKVFSDKYINSNFNDFWKQKADSVQALLIIKGNESTDKNAYSPLASKNALMADKLQLQIAYDQSKNSIATLDRELAHLQAKLKNLVPNEAVIQSMENTVDVAQKDYLEVLQKDGQANLQPNDATKLHQVDPAVPGPPQSSKKLLFVAMSFVVSEVICILVIFIIFYLDTSINNPRALAQKSGLPVLGYLTMIAGQTLDLKKLWNVENRTKMQKFKDLLRSIRFEIDQELNGNKVLAITSLSPSEGKTLLSISLAYSYSIINKKVLLIDGNLDNPSISSTVQPKLFVEDFFKDDSPGEELLRSGISVLGNRGTDLTLLEIGEQKIIREKFDQLKLKYDIIIIEVPDMSALNKAKEWLLFADKAVAVYEAGTSINEDKNAAVKYLQHLGVNFGGWIFNKAAVDTKS